MLEFKTIQILKPNTEILDVIKGYTYKVKKGTILAVTVERVKELNAKRKGRVVDIIESVNTNQIEEEISEDIQKEERKEIEYTEEDLKAKTVNELKELAEEIKCELTKATKKEIIEEIISFQESKKEKGE